MRNARSRKRNDRPPRVVAVVSASLFAGAALYINVAEHPARMLFERANAARQWAPSYKRATWLQAPLALVSLVTGATVWLAGFGCAWLIAALLIGAIVPFTFVGIMPTNHRLLSSSLDLRSDEARALLMRWGKLHAVRTILSLVAAVIYSCLHRVGRLTSSATRSATSTKKCPATGAGQVWGINRSIRQVTRYSVRSSV
jgi:hypothetical protein